MASFGLLHQVVRATRSYVDFSEVIHVTGPEREAYPRDLPERPLLVESTGPNRFHGGRSQTDAHGVYLEVRSPAT